MQAALATLTSVEALRNYLTSYSLDLEERLALADVARRQLGDLLQGLPNEDPATLLAPSVPLRVSGLLRYAFLTALQERLGPGQSVNDLPFVEEVVRALEALYGHIPAELQSGDLEVEEGVARSRLRAYARVLALGLEAASAVATTLALPVRARYRLAAGPDEVISLLEESDSPDLSSYAAKHFTKQVSSLTKLARSGEEGLAHFLCLAVLVGITFFEKRVVEPLPSASLNDLFNANSLPIDLLALQQEAHVWAQAYAQDVVGSTDETLDLYPVRVATVFVAFAAWGYVARRHAQS